jgi:integrase
MARGSIYTSTLQDGTKVYRTVLRIDGSDGKRKQVWKTFDKKKAAEGYLDRNSNELREGTFRELKRASFDQYVTSWKKKHLIVAKLKPATLNSYGSNIALHLSPAFGPCQLTAIDSDEITTFESKLLTSGQSPKSARNILQLLSRILKDARTDGYLRISPMTDLKLSKLNKEEARVLTKDEVTKLLVQCETDATLRLVVLLGLLAGLRRNEIFALSWEDFDAAGNVLNIKKNLFWRHGVYQGERDEDEPAWLLHTPKTKASLRAVDLSPKLRGELQEYYLRSEHKTGLIFQTSNGGPMDPHNFYERQFKPAIENAVKADEELPLKERSTFTDVTLHTLRHTFGSIKLETGENLIYVSKQMGHANPSITANVYAHLLKERRPEAAVRTDEFLFGKAIAKV